MIVTLSLLTIHYMIRNTTTIETEVLAVVTPQFTLRAVEDLGTMGTTVQAMIVAVALNTPRPWVVKCRDTARIAIFPFMARARSMIEG